jgi:hypothetical protein
MSVAVDSDISENGHIRFPSSIVGVLGAFEAEGEILRLLVRRQSPVHVRNDHHATTDLSVILLPEDIFIFDGMGGARLLWILTL